MPDQITPVPVTAPAEPVAVAATATEATVATVELETVPATAPDGEELPAEVERAVPIVDLEAMVSEFGAETACEVLLNGGDMTDARELHTERLKAENETLRKQLADRDTDTDIGEDPVTFTDGEPATEPDPAAEKAAKDKRVNEYAVMHGLTPGQARYALSAEDKRNNAKAK